MGMPFLLEQALWSAAACCRFPFASLLAIHRSEYRAPVHGQQAGLSKSGSKLPHSRAPHWKKVSSAVRRRINSLSSAEKKSKRSRSREMLSEYVSLCT